MTLLRLKQAAAKLKESDRRQLSAYLIKLGHQGRTWRKEMSRRMRAMDNGRKVSLSQLERRIANA